jgi:hypothetical protein
MSDFVVTLTPVVNRSTIRVIGVEGDLDTSVDADGKSVQRTAFIQTYDAGTNALQAVCVCYDQATGNNVYAYGPGTRDNGVTDVAQEIGNAGRSGYPSETITVYTP